MIDSTLLANIESSEKAVAWGVVGSRRKLDAAVLTDSDVRELLNALRDQPAARRQLVTRIGSLATIGGSPEYLHRYDLAIFAYLRVLDVLDPISLPWQRLEWQRSAMSGGLDLLRYVFACRRTLIR